MQTRKVTREETEPSRSGAAPLTDNANAAASSSTQNSKTRGGTKRLASGTNTQNTDAAAPSGKSRKTEHESEDTVTGANAFTFKRKKETVSGAIPPTWRPRTSATDVEGSFNRYGKEGHVRSIAEVTISVCHRAWNDTMNDVCDDDFVFYHNNVIVGCLLDHDLVMDVMELLCADGNVMTYEIDFPQIQSYVIDLRNMFVNTTNWSGGDSAHNSWKAFNVVRQYQTQAEPARRLLCDMLVVVLNRIQQAFSFVSPYYHTHRLWYAPHT